MEILRLRFFESKKSGEKKKKKKAGKNFGREKNWL